MKRITYRGFLLHVTPWDVTIEEVYGGALKARLSSTVEAKDWVDIYWRPVEYNRARM